MKKSELRKSFKLQRLQLAPGELNRASERITDFVLERFQLENKRISLFLPIERHGEINTYTLLERAKNIGAHVALPVSNFHTNELVHRLYNSDTTLHLNAYGIPEPAVGKTIKPAEFDYVFVPLLAVDKMGNRVGYGKGFYDRFLKKCKPTCKFIGLSIFDPVDCIEDADPHDIPLHYIVTPNGTLEIHS
jgi:5-formyltetrahydrofolate cyclo-ligase